MKLICSTSDNYHHVLKVFAYLFNEYWSEDQVVDVVGYKKPDDLPKNFVFHQMNNGVQEGIYTYGRDLRAIVEEIVEDDYFIYTMEDTFIKKPVDFAVLDAFYELLTPEHKIGRIDLTEGMSYRATELYTNLNGIEILKNPQNVPYRITCQMSIWSKEYFLKRLHSEYSPWDFEIKGTQESYFDGYNILGTHRNDRLAVIKNEGVIHKNPANLILSGIEDKLINEMKERKLI